MGLEPNKSQICLMLHFHDITLHLSAQYTRLSDGLFPKCLLEPWHEALELVAQTIIW